jgi:hypothetical protein
MRTSVFVTGALLILPSLPALACEVPSLPIFPDDERIRGRLERELNQEMVGYITDMSVYVACVQAEHQAARREGAPEIRLALLAARHNRAISELEDVRDVYEARVGPIEELFFEQPFDAGDQRPGAPPRSMPVPMGPDSVLRRTEIILGDGFCPELAPCSKEVSSPGMERNVQPLTRPTQSIPER